MLKHETVKTTQLRLNTLPNNVLKAMAALFVWLLPMLSHAQTSVDFSTGDWQLVCDNTRTCRAAGYQEDAHSDLPISVLLIRKAGPNQAVTGQVVLGSYDEESYQHVESLTTLRLTINGNAIGPAIDFKAAANPELSAEHVRALLTTLTKHSDIRFVGGALDYRLSDKGATAVLLKMDEFQGRLGTRSAIVRKGNQSDKNVLPALPVPVVTAVTPIEYSEQEKKQFLDKNKSALIAVLRKTLNEDDCPSITEIETDIDVNRLTDNKVLVSTPCWFGAYNSSASFFVINNQAPFKPVFVTDAGNYYGAGEIGAQHKGRGLGDCWSSETWVWDGKQFIHASASSTGLCRLIEAGGAWQLPTLLTDVRKIKE